MCLTDVTSPTSILLSCVLSVYSLSMEISFLCSFICPSYKGEVNNSFAKSSVARKYRGQAGELETLCLAWCVQFCLRRCIMAPEDPELSGVR